MMDEISFELVLAISVGVLIGKGVYKVVGLIGIGAFLLMDYFQDRKQRSR